MGRFRSAGRRACLFCVTACCAGTAAGAAANPSAPRDELPLPQPPPAATALDVPGIKVDRLRLSFVPGAVSNDETVTVSVGPTGVPGRVELVQRLRVTGVGDYGIYERGPTREAEALDGTPGPVTKLGTVVWQGFSPGSRDLAARLVLDPQLEALRLPARVALSFRDATGISRVLGPGGEIPAAGSVRVVLANATAQPATVASGVAAAADLAPVADALLLAAAQPGREPPVAGAGLPRSLPADAVQTRAVTVSAALRVTGTVRVSGTTVRVSGPGARPLPDGARVEGTLAAGEVGFDVAVGGPGRLQLDLTVAPVVDRRVLVPPNGSSWRGWAAGSPDPAERRAATDRVQEAAAAAVRATAYVPYLQADLPGPSQTSFRYVVAPRSAAVAARAQLRAEPLGIALAVVAFVLVTAVAGLLWRRL